MIFGIILFLNIPGTSKQDKNSFKSVKNNKPKYEKAGYVSLTPLYTIPFGITSDKFYISDASWLDVDNAGHLYVLDFYESKIHKFNQKGEYLKSFGGPGERPQDLYRPEIFLY